MKNAFNPTTIRRATPDDAAAVAALSRQLGYTASTQQSRDRLLTILELNDHAVFVASLPDGPVIAWIHVFLAMRIESQTFAELGGLVVDDKRRGHGVGKGLLDEAETWTRIHGVEKLRVRSRSSRDDAHAFYTGVGFSTTKEQRVYDKPLAQNTST